MSRDRWPVEGLPLWATQRLGAVRQLVFAPPSRQRLPALALLAGSLRASTAATSPARPPGCWERAPQPTAGRLRRGLAQGHFHAVQGLPQQLRKKLSPTAHVPKGGCGHRRQKKAALMPDDMPRVA